MYFYIDFLYSEQGRTIFLEISTTTYYNNMQEWLDELSQYSTREHEIAVQNESWLIDYYPDNEERTPIRHYARQRCRLCTDDLAG